jgi:hypothetical protein
MRMVNPELRYLWDALSANERRVLAALASGYSPYQQEAKIFMGLANRSSAARAAGGGCPPTFCRKLHLVRRPPARLRATICLTARYWIRRTLGHHPDFRQPIS